MKKNKSNGCDNDFMISSGPVPRKPSPAGDGMPTPKDYSGSRNPEFEYPPTSKLPSRPTGKE